MVDRQAEMRAAAKAAVGYVLSGMRVGLGSGATAGHAIRLLGERVRIEGLKITGVPTSTASRDLAIAEGIPLSDDTAGFELDLAIDGADQLTRGGEMIKGGGGALLRERIVAAAAKQFFVIADSTKLVEQLGTFPLPVEVVPFGWKNVFRRLQNLGCEPTLRLQKNGEPIQTDEGNLILDCRFANDVMPPLAQLDRDLRAIAGVAEHGLFLGMARRLFIARGEKVEEIVL